MSSDVVSPLRSPSWGLVFGSLLAPSRLPAFGFPSSFRLSTFGISRLRCFSASPALLMCLAAITLLGSFDRCWHGHVLTGHDLVGITFGGVLPLRCPRRTRGLFLFFCFCVRYGLALYFCSSAFWVSGFLRIYPVLVFWPVCVASFLHVLLSSAYLNES